MNHPPLTMPALALGVALALSSAHAQDTGTEDVAGQDRWTVLDANGDGRISAEEGAVDADFAAGFEMVDADDDGYVTDAEFRADAGRADDGADDAEAAAADETRDRDRDDHTGVLETEPVETDPMTDRDGMDDDGTGLDDDDRA